MQRFARQVLLKPVGERGQEALLAAAVEVRGLSVTAAYLNAGGTPVRGAPAGLFGEPGGAEGEVLGLIAPSVVDFTKQTRAVAVGAEAIAFHSGACGDCFARTARSLKVGAPTVALEALAALAWQRLALGLSAPLGTFALEGPPPPVLRCEAHA